MSEKIEEYLYFIKEKAPEKIKEDLDYYIVGQPELTKEVAKFLYYHAIRQLNPDLPPRPMLITGPSGSGKTEVWRVAQRLYNDVFHIIILNGALMTQEGWKGEEKLSKSIADQAKNDSIIVIDEFDKQTAPQHTTNGDNISAAMQSEYLKLMEGEMQITKSVSSTISQRMRDIRSIPTIKPLNEKIISTKQMGLVMVGAFEEILDKKRNIKSPVGFGDKNEHLRETKLTITDEDLIEYGLLTELVGRISTKCTTNELTNEQYMEILMHPNSRVSIIKTLLTDDLLTKIIPEDEIMQLISSSKTNKTGFRWVSAQIENELLDMLYESNIQSRIIKELESNNAPEAE